MKFWKHTLISAFAFLGISSTVLYTSCEQDSCVDLKCRNGGACVEGFCRCPSGYEGTECETQVATKFIGRFIGHYACPDETPKVDTVDIWLLQGPNKVRFVNHLDITDTIDAIVNGTDLQVEPKVDGSYKRYTVGNIDANKLTIFAEEIFNPTTGEKKTCSFIGFK